MSGSMAWVGFFRVLEHQCRTTWRRVVPTARSRPELEEQLDAAYCTQIQVLGKSAFSKRTSQTCLRSKSLEYLLRGTSA